MATRTKGTGKGARTAAGARTPAKKAKAARPATSAAATAARDGDTERRILDAARRIFVRRGSAGARMQEIAEEAGVNQALLHYYFRTKDGLALAVFREAAGQLVPGVLRTLVEDAPLDRRVERVVHHYIDTLRENPFLPGYVIGELNFNPERIAAAVRELTAAGASVGSREAMERLDRELATRAAAGEVRPMRAAQFIVNLAALCVFPFAARPMIAVMFGVGGADWDRFLDERRAELPRYILQAIRP